MWRLTWVAAMSCLLSYAHGLAMYVDGDIVWHEDVQSEVEYRTAVKSVTRVC